MVAVAIEGHPYHEKALAVLTALEAGGHQCVVSGHSLAEIYAVHVHSAVKAGCEQLYTFNVRDFEACLPGGFQGKVVEP